MSYSFFSDVLSHLTHPFVAQGLLAVFILAEGFKCVKLNLNNAVLRQVSATLVCVLFAYALYAHLVVDTRYFFVMQNNHPAQAIHYRIASLWSHHETSLLVWLVIMNSTTYILRLPSDVAQFRGRILALLNCLLGFYMLMESSPFATTPFAQVHQESHGLNPLLYDLNMVWHPPLLYLGATWLFTPYVLSLWLYRTRDVTLIPLIQRYTKIAFGLLTLAIALGSFWAFTQLGWGGFWFWDPVETASLLPWVSALIVFHSAPLSLKKNPWIAGMPFACVMLSLWAVRSGMLVSVHSFANDVMAFWLLGALALFTGLPLFVMLCARFKITHESTNTPYMKAGLWLLAFTLFLLMLGLFVPVALNFNLAATFFNVLLLPVWATIALLMVIAPYKGLRFGASTTMALLGLMLYLSCYSQLALPYIFLGASGAICVSAMLPLIRTKPRVSLAHMGIGFCLIGLASYSDSPPEATLSLTRGVPLTHTSYQITFDDTFEVAEPFKTNQCAHISITKADNVPIDNATPQAHTLPQTRTSPQAHATPQAHTLILTPARQFFHTSQLQRAKADFGLLDQRIVMITNIESAPDGGLIIIFHEKCGLLWLVLGCGLIVLAILMFPLGKLLFFRYFSAVFLAK